MSTSSAIALLAARGYKQSKYCRFAYAQIPRYPAHTPWADENDPGEQPVHTDELVAPAEPDAVSVTDAINKHTGLSTRVARHIHGDINGISTGYL